MQKKRLRKRETLDPAELIPDAELGTAGEGKGIDADHRSRTSRDPCLSLLPTPSSG